MQRLIGLLRRLRGRPPPGSAPAPRAAEPREQRRGGLHCAAASGDLARLQRRWWRKWFRINERDAEKQTPLHLACANGHAAVVRFLAGKKCKLNPCDSFQKSPLMKAVERQHKDCVAILLEHGASPDLKGPGGNTALHLAAVIPNKSLVELLLAHKAHIDAQNELGYTPLTLAITEHCEEMVEFLLQKGADVHARDNRKRTTLMLAACAGDMNIIQILLHHGADLSHQDPFGCTAEYYAREFQHDDIADQLEKYMFYEGMGECFARGTEGPAVDGRFCSALTAEFTSGAPAGVLPAAGAEEEKDVDSWSDFELDFEDLKKESAGILLPPADEHRAHVHSGAEERGNGVLPAAGAEEEKDVDSWSDFELDSEDLKKESAGILLPPADEHRAHVHSGAEERGNGVLPAAGAEEEKDVDSWSDFELDSEDLKKESAGILLPPADEHRAHAHSGAEERGNGVLPAAGAEEEKDVDSWSDFELDSEDLKKESAGILLPPADEHRAHAHSGAEERGNGVLPAAGAEEEKDVDSWSDFELDSEDLKKESAGILLPPADEHRAHAHSGAEERGNGVLPAAGAEEEKDEDSWSDFELDSEDLKKESAGILLPPADEHRAHAHSGAEERGNGVLPVGRAEQEEGFDSCSENKVLFLREKWVMRLQQDLADALRKNSLAEASLEAKKCYSRDLQEQKLRLQKELDRSKAKLQEVKERYICTECYAESLKNAIKEKELTTSRNVQAILAMPSAAVAIPELEEQVQQLQVVMTRLEATAQQQAKTTEALQKDQQASASAHNVPEDLITRFQTPSAKEHLSGFWE
ncbi:ankyrin repeat domain-containing protein 30A-like isoform X3 [Tyto alba]|uniref:ankyrin repeat domain-containing protein 30A-like isoform X3 n=1 Tax=Tyto alba TaxID=56313 RepID=UPI001C6848BE|nr:ankyrin repeat domain-containing protein 30A-like isoform X3 [Tyto alba]